MATDAEDTEPGISRGRLEAFSDGVMAVAITLLVLGVEAPDPAPGESLWQALDTQTLGSLALFVLSFAVIARFWLVHHDAFKSLPARVPTPLVAANFGFLLMICLVPFSTSLFASESNDMLALVVYAATFAVVSGCLAILIAQGRDGLTVRSIAIPAVFLAAIPVGVVVGPAYAPWTWLLLTLTSSGRLDAVLARRLR